MRIALLLFILVPVVELAVLIQVGGEIGGLTTIALVFLTAIVGVSLIRKQGLETSQKAQEKMQRGELPASEMAEGLMLVFAGVCLLIPGFVTDAIGGVLLIPFFRKLLAAGLILKFMSSVMQRSSQWRTGANRTGQNEDIIEGEFVNEENDLIDKK
ncbi:FxsA family protein [Marinomonas sp. C2222]|uniref:FxsA family protein n=1 Tax=Marinomonas sargassi TaxID=2984494 RepID=A0ABT2YSI8_9GAMM|nr:FxsA family protein [Marinomonas sargassi]MCV2402846.1 FxsA family protein [Marinomonas sargassi]